MCPDKPISKELVPRRCDTFDDVLPTELEFRASYPEIYEFGRNRSYYALNCTVEEVDVSMLEFQP